MSRLQLVDILGRNAEHCWRVLPPQPTGELLLFTFLVQRSNNREQKAGEAGPWATGPAPPAVTSRSRVARKHRRPSAGAPADGPCRGRGQLGEPRFRRAGGPCGPASWSAGTVRPGVRCWRSQQLRRPQLPRRPRLLGHPTGAVEGPRGGGVEALARCGPGPRQPRPSRRLPRRWRPWLPARGRRSILPEADHPRAKRAQAGIPASSCSTASCVFGPSESGSRVTLGPTIRRHIEAQACASRHPKPGRPASRAGRGVALSRRARQRGRCLRN